MFEIPAYLKGVLPVLITTCSTGMREVGAVPTKRRRTEFGVELSAKRFKFNMRPLEPDHRKKRDVTATLEGMLLGYPGFNG